MRSIKVFNMITNDDVNFYYESLDNVNCPICTSLQRPLFKSESAICNGEVLFLFCYCLGCKKTYISEYNYSKTVGVSTTYYIGEYIKSYPANNKIANFDERIKKLSSTFIKIYEQALTAESIGMDELYGMGYRKAFEFLLKDYAVSICSDVEKKEKLPKMNLSQVINEIGDNQIKQFAEKCVWLLNDETHYFRKYEKQDIEDIKNLINATVLTITSKLYAESIVKR